MVRKYNKDHGFGVRKQTSFGLPRDERQERGGTGLGLRCSSSSSVPTPLEKMSYSLPLTNTPPLLTWHPNLLLRSHF